MYKKGRLFIDNLGSFNAKIDLEVELNIQVNLALQYVRLIGEHVARSGTSVNSWLEQSGISREEFDAPGFSTNFTTFRRLTLDAIQLTREPALGLVIGEQLGVHAHGALGYAAMNCSSMSEVLDLVEQYLQLRIGLIRLSKIVTDNTVEVRLQELIPLGDIQSSILEGVVCSIKNVLEDVSMGVCSVSEVHFPYQEPSYSDLARAIFGAQVRYNSRFCRLILPKHVLALQLRMADPRAFKTAEELCRRELEQLRQQNSTTSQVRRLLIERRHHLPSLSATARLLHLTPRTLHRRLLAEGTSFREILEDLRFALARDYLISEHVGVDEVAYVLGYSDAANFRRAFKRWAGMPPSVFRERHLQRLSEH